MTTKKLNPWSIVAALCAIGLCPLFSIAAVLAGIRAIVEIKAREDTCGFGSGQQQSPRSVSQKYSFNQESLRGNVASWRIFLTMFEDS